MNADFYQRHLNRVSRSFAFCIEQLHSPLREWIGLAYLLCRAVDTVEDSAWPSREAQSVTYAEFLGFLKALPTAEQIARWQARFPQNIPEGERQLIDDLAPLLEDLHRLPQPCRKALMVCLKNMTEGMRSFSNRSQEERLRLYDLTAVNQYCFFVAGIIGELLTELVSAAYPQLQPDHRLWLNSFHFGLFLQKINLLKDQTSDEQEGRYFIPDREQVRASLRVHAPRALEYILALPVDLQDFRTFCAWSYFLGLYSLPFIDRSWQEHKPVKISRIEAFSALAQVQANIDNNEALRTLALSLGVGEAGPPWNASPSSTGWIRQIYDGRLSEGEMRELGV